MPPLLILMGHDKCGAVAAAMEAKGKPEGNIGAIVAKILPSVKKAKAKGGTGMRCSMPQSGRT